MPLLACRLGGIAEPDYLRSCLRHTVPVVASRTNGLSAAEPQRYRVIWVPGMSFAGSLWSRDLVEAVLPCARRRSCRSSASACLCTVPDRAQRNRAPTGALRGERAAERNHGNARGNSAPPIYGCP